MLRVSILLQVLRTTSILKAKHEIKVIEKNLKAMGKGRYLEPKCDRDHPTEKKNKMGFLALQFLSTQSRRKRKTV